MPVKGIGKKSFKKFGLRSQAVLEIVEDLSNAGIETFVEGEDEDGDPSLITRGTYVVKIGLPGKNPPAPALLSAYKKAQAEAAGAGRVPVAITSANIEGVRQSIVTLPLWKFLCLVSER